MVRFIVSGLLIVLNLAATQVGFAGATIEEAESLFDQREGSFEKIEQSRAKFLEVLKAGGLERTDLINVIEKLARLAIYEYDMLPKKTENEHKLKVMDQCVKLTEQLDPAKIGTNPQYYYYRMACLGLWGKAKGVSLDVLLRLPEIRDLYKKGAAQADYKKYAGGGLDRIAGAIEYNIPTGSIDKSIKFLQEAVASEAHPESENPQTENGKSYYINYFFLAEAMQKADRIDEARQIVEEALERIEDDADLPVGREPETKVHRQDLRNLLKEFGN